MLQSDGELDFQRRRRGGGDEKISGAKVLFIHFVFFPYIVYATRISCNIYY